MGGDRGEDVAAVEGGRERLEPVRRAADVDRLDGAAEDAGGRDQQADHPPPLVGGQDMLELLLNSDTVVTTGWLERLLACAASDARIATVTPFSNNATICSYPTLRGGGLPFGCGLAEVVAGGDRLAGERPRR